MLSGKAYGFWSPCFWGSDSGSAPTSCSIRERQAFPSASLAGMELDIYHMTAYHVTNHHHNHYTALKLPLSWVSVIGQLQRDTVWLFSSKGGKLDPYRVRWRKEERQHAIVFAEFLLNIRFLLWQWYPCSNWNISMPHQIEKECRCRDGVKRMDVICPVA